MPSQETRPRSRRPEWTCRCKPGRRCRSHRTRWLLPRASRGTPRCRSFGMPRELDFRRVADQSLGCVGGLDEDLRSTRISAAISVGRVEMQFPNDPEPVAGQQVESNPFVESAIELLHGIPPQFNCPVCRSKRSAASAIWLKSSTRRGCPLSACFDRQSRDDLRPITVQQIARQSFTERAVEPAGHGSGATERSGPPPYSRREGGLRRGCLANTRVLQGSNRADARMSLKYKVNSRHNR